MRRTIRMWAGAVALATVAACGGGGGGGGGDPKPPPERLGVQLKEFSVTLGKSSIPAGRVRFNAGNVGTIPHKLVIFRTDLAPEALPMKGNVVDEQGTGLTLVGSIDEIDPAKNERKIFAVTAGKHVLICNVQSHYQQGMRAALTIT